MSNLWLNIRFGTHHLQWAYGDWLPQLNYNEYHKGKPFKVEVYVIKSPF